MDETASASSDGAAAAAEALTDSLPAAGNPLESLQLGNVKDFTPCRPASKKTGTSAISKRGLSQFDASFEGGW